jgi:hypothetical protein
MNATFLLTAAQHGARRIPKGLVLAVALPFLHQNATATTIDLGTASSFAILGGSEVTFTAPTTTVMGDVGVSPGTSITGTPANLSQTGGTIHDNDAVAAQAQLDLTTAYNAAAGAASTATIANSLGSGQTLGPGVYNFSLPTDVNLIGTLTLSGSGLYVFQVPSDLQTAIGSSVELINGAEASHVFWQVGITANLLGSDFDGTIMALTSITLGDGVTADGRLLARNAEVTLIDDTITTPVCNVASGVPDGGSTLLLLGFGVLGLLALLEVRGQFLMLTQNRRAIS